MSDKLFENLAAGCTIIRNEVFDTVLPRLSSDEWKVLCVALRQALSGAPAEALPLAEFVTRSGIKDTETVQKALMACVGAEFLSQSDDLYALNADLTSERFAGETETEAEVEEAYPVPASIPPEKARAYRDLMLFGEAMGAESKAAVVEQAVLLNEMVDTLAWIHLGREMAHLAMADRFQAVMDRLMAQVPPLHTAIVQVEAVLEAEAAAAAAEAAAEAAAAAGPDLGTPEGLWEAALTVLETKMRSNLFKWVKGATPISLENGVLTVVAPNERTREWLETGNMAGTIKKVFASIAGDVELQFTVAA